MIRIRLKRRKAPGIDFFRLCPNDHRFERDDRVETTRISKNAPGGEVASSQL